MTKAVDRAYASFVVVNSKRAIVDMHYRFHDGREHTGFSTVDVSRSVDLYDKCYERAESLAEIQGCRLERFKHAGAKFTIYYTNFGTTDDRTFDELEVAKRYAEQKGFEATINHNGRPVGSWSPVSGYQDLTE